MGSSRIFDGIVRTDDSPCGHNEATATFLNRAAGASWEQVRHLLEEWASHIPALDRGDLVGRLRSPINSQFAGAFWELYLHETLKRCGFVVTIHPNVEGVRRKPDFLVTSKESSFYVEAKALLTPEADPGANGRRRQLYDSLNKISSPNFFLAINESAIGPSDLPTRPLRTALEKWLDSLDPGAISLTAFDEDPSNTFPWVRDGWEIRFRAIPIRADARGQPDHRPLGVFGPSAAWVNSDLKAALSDKGSAYGELGHPLVIAVNTFGFSNDDFDVMNALYGSLQIRVSVHDPGADAVEMRARDGYWAAGEWAHRHVSGLLIGRSLTPWNVAQNVPTLWRHPHPYADAPSLGTWRIASVVDDKINFTDARESIHSFLGLPADWPAE